METIDVKSKTNQELEEMKTSYFEHRALARNQLNSFEVEMKVLKRDKKKLILAEKNGRFLQIQKEINYYKSKFQEYELLLSSVTRELKLRAEEEIQSKKITKGDVFMSVAREILPKQLYDDIMTEVRVKMIYI